MEPVSGFSATPGCLIVVCGLLGVVGFLIWAGFTFVKQNGEIDAFTAKAPVEIAPLNVETGDRDALVEKLNVLKAAVPDRKPAEISLNAEELNILLSLKPFSDKNVDTVFRVEKIADGFVHARISFPLNAFPPGTFRYLNGTLLCNPIINEEIGLVLNTEDIRVPDKVVAEGFLRRYKQDGYLDDMLLLPFRDEDGDKKLAAVLKAITTAEVRGDTVVVGYDPEVPRG
jgi:hypothetical protein